MNLLRKLNFLLFNFLVLLSLFGLSRICVLAYLKLTRNERGNAVDILVKDLKIFACFNEDLFKEITQLLTLENFRYVYACSKILEF